MFRALQSLLMAENAWDGLSNRLKSQDKTKIAKVDTVDTKE